MLNTTALTNNEAFKFVIIVDRMSLHYGVATE